MATMSQMVLISALLICGYAIMVSGQEKAPAQLAEVYISDGRYETPTTFEEALIAGRYIRTSNCDYRRATCSAESVLLRAESETKSCAPRCSHFCYYRERDFLIILDSSGSISKDDYDEAKVDLAIIAPHLCGHIGCNLRVAGIQFSSEAVKEFGFNTYTTAHTLWNGIIAMSRQAMGTNTHLAFELAEVMFTVANGQRPGAIKQALIVTDGKSNNGAKAIAAATSLKESGVEIFAVWIGNPYGDDFDEIREYVSEPIDIHVFSVSSVMELSKLADSIEILHDTICDCHCH